MTSKIIVNQIEGDVGVSSVTFNDTIYGSVEGNVTGNVTGDITVGTNATISGSTNTITASTVGTERVRVTGTGSVGVGLINPDSKFHVKATTNHVATFEYSSTSDMAIQLKNSQGSMYFGLGGGEEFMVGIATDLNGAGNTKLSVDQNGAVRTPDQPAALVYKTGTNQNL